MPRVNATLTITNLSVKIPTTMKGWIFMKHKIYYGIFIFAFIFSAVALIHPAPASYAAKKTKLNVKKLTLTKNDTYTLRVYNLKKKHTVKFVSADDSIVSVRENANKKSAVITAVSLGTAQIRANIYNRKDKLVRSLKTNVKVTPFAVSIKFAQKKVKLALNDTTKLPVIIKPRTSHEVPLFESSNPDVVTVNSKGIITAIAPGNAIITATLLSGGQKAECEVTVAAPPSPTPDSQPDPLE